MADVEAPVEVKETTLQIVQRVLIKQYGAQTQPQADTTFASLNLDSLDALEIVMSVEDEIKHELDDMLLLNTARGTVGDFAVEVDRQLAEHNPPS